MKEFICPVSERLTYLGVMCERKKIALSHRESSESETPGLLTFPHNPQLTKKGNNTISFKDVFSEKQANHHLAAESHLSKEMGMFTKTRVFLSGYLNVTPSVQLV